MTLVAVTGGGSRAAEWATRFLASGLDVVVDDPAAPAAVAGLWPSAQRLGLFPSAGFARLRVAETSADLSGALLVQAVAGDQSMPPTAGGHLATEATARACSPIHLVPLVEVSGPDAAWLAEFYTSIGMAPVGPEASAHARWQLGEGLVRLTDGEPDALVAVMRALRSTGTGAGAALAHHEAVRLAAGAAAPWQPGDEVVAPLALYRTPVEPDWVDYNGHMTEAAYLTAAGWASDALFRYIGDDEAYRAAGHSFYTVETHIHYMLEASVHEPITFTTQVLGADAKRLHLVHTMFHGDTGGMLCTVEQMLLHVDMRSGRSAAILPRVAAALTAVTRAHSHLPIPRQVGSVMRLPPPRD